MQPEPTREPHLRQPPVDPRKLEEETQHRAVRGTPLPYRLANSGTTLLTHLGQGQVGEIFPLDLARHIHILGGRSGESRLIDALGRSIGPLRSS